MCRFPTCVHWLNSRATRRDKFSFRPACAGPRTLINEINDLALLAFSDYRREGHSLEERSKKRGRHHQTFIPPSTAMSVPAPYELSSDDRSRTTCAPRIP